MATPVNMTVNRALIRSSWSTRRQFLEARMQALGRRIDEPIIRYATDFYHDEEDMTYNDDATRMAAELYSPSMLCPITQEPFRDPVVAADGHSYERMAIKRWFLNKNRSPKTNVLISTHLLTNHALRAAVDEATESLKVM